MCRLRNIAVRQTDRQTTDKVIPMCRYASQATQKQNNLHWSICKSIQMLYHGTTAIHSTPCWTCVHAQAHMFIYRSYVSIYKLHGHLIPSHTKRLVAEWWERWTGNQSGGGVGGSNPTVGKIFVMFTCAVFLWTRLDWQRSNEIKHDIHPR